MKYVRYSVILLFAGFFAFLADRGSGTLSEVLGGEAFILAVLSFLVFRTERSNKTVEALEELIAWREAAGNKPPLALKFDKEGRMETVLPYGKSVATLQNLKPPCVEGPHIMCGPASVLSAKQFQELRRVLEAPKEGNPSASGLNYDYVSPGPHPLGNPTFLQRMHDPCGMSEQTPEIREVMLWRIGQDLYKKYGVRICYRVQHISPDKSHRKYWVAAISLPGEETQVRLAGTSDEYEKKMMEKVVDPELERNPKDALEVQGPVTYSGVHGPFLGVLGLR